MERLGFWLKIMGFRTTISLCESLSSDILSRPCFNVDDYITFVLAQPKPSSGLGPIVRAALLLLSSSWFYSPIPHSLFKYHLLVSNAIVGSPIFNQAIMDGRRRSASVMNVGLAEGAGDDLFRRLSRTFSGKSQHQEPSEEQDIERWTSRNDGKEVDDSSEKTKVNEWRLDSHVKDIHSNDPAEGRSLGVTWKDLTVKVVPSDATLQENVLSQFNVIQQAKEGRNKAPLKTILDSSSGCVKPGEMLLVLGRPGSGCTTLLKMLANKRKGYVTDLANLPLVVY